MKRAAKDDTPTPGHSTEQRFPRVRWEVYPLPKAFPKTSILWAETATRMKSSSPFPYPHTHGQMGNHQHPTWKRPCRNRGLLFSKPKPASQTLQLPDVKGQSSPSLRFSGSSGLNRGCSHMEGQVIKKLFVDLDWIDHLFPKFLFPSFTHYTPPPDVRGHLLASAFIMLAKRNILQHFLRILSFIYWLRDWSIFRGRKN